MPFKATLNYKELFSKTLPVLMTSDWFLLAGVRFFSVLLGVFIVLSSLIYGASVYYERIISLEGREARQVEEENMALRVDLDKLQAYQKVSTISLKHVHLRPASDPITVMAKRTVKAPDVPIRVSEVPRQVYGF